VELPAPATPTSPSPPRLIKRALQDRAHQANIAARRQSGILNSMLSLEPVSDETPAADAPATPVPPALAFSATSPQSFNLPRTIGSAASSSASALRAIAPLPASMDQLADGLERSASVSSRRKRFKPRPSIVAPLEAAAGQAAAAEMEAAPPLEPRNRRRSTIVHSDPGEFGTRDPGPGEHTTAASAVAPDERPKKSKPASIKSREPLMAMLPNTPTQQVTPEESPKVKAPDDQLGRKSSAIRLSSVHEERLPGT
jgi:hypothetical protein